MLETERGGGGLFEGLSWYLATNDYDSKYVKKKENGKMLEKISAVKYTFKRNHNEQECEQFQGLLNYVETTQTESAIIFKKTLEALQFNLQL